MRTRHGSLAKEPHRVSAILCLGEGERRERLALRVLVQHNVDVRALRDSDFDPLGAEVEADERLPLRRRRSRGRSCDEACYRQQCELLGPGRAARG